MNQHLQNILNLIQQDDSLTAEQKNAITQSLKDADKELQITAFKLDRTEKVKRTTAILLEETIEELEQKRKAVEAQNRELEIESSLERVRTVAMSMMKSDHLLKICESVFNELHILGFTETDLRNVQIVINDDEKGIYYGYQYSDYIGGEIAEVPYDLHPTIRLLNDRLRLSKDAFADIEISGERLEDWKGFVNNFPQKYDEKLNAAAELHYYFYSVGVGALGISSFQSLSEYKLAILQRLRNVFNLSYQRYTDIALAEAQARESQIQLAMERVRARTMAMQKSDELAEVSSLLFQQLKSLGVNSYSSGFTIWDHDSNDLISWMCNADGSMNPPFRMPIAGDAWHIRQYESWRKGKDFIINDMTGDRMQSYFRYLRSFPLLDAAFEKSIAAGHPMPERQVHNVANFSHGNLLFITLEPYSEAVDMFKRFAKVFEQTYTRFLDLQKAEAQAREAKIETALEKVRSRTMAMQRSDELGDVAEIIFKQVKELGIHPWTTGFNIWQEGNDAYIDWITNPSGGFVEPYTVDLTAHPIFREISNAKKRGEEFQVFDLSGESLAETYALLMSFAPKQFEGFLSSGFSFPTRQFNHYVYGVQVGLMFITPEPCPEAHDIFKRFGKVFEQTYTRFLDLQKAEAQSRESQIELALERIRAKTMAMQKSEELRDVIQVVFQQFQELSFKIDAASFVIDHRESDDLNTWIASSAVTYPTKILIPYIDNDILNLFKKAKEKDLDFATGTLSFDEKNKFFKHFFNHATIPPERQTYLLSAPGYATSVVFMSNFSLFIANYAGIPFSEAENAILRRIAKVFEQSYTRFLDLQKAEAQAREAKIEAALEKVRSRTMAMHQSDELAETAHVLFEQFRDLGENPERMAIGIVKEDEKVIEIWATQHGGTLMNTMYRFTIEEPHVMNRLYTAWKKQESITIDLKGKELEEYFQFLKNAGAPVDRNAFGDRRIQMAAFFSKGLLMTISSDPRPDGTLDLLERFASVFNLTYTRFLDLQKAEGQAKEAQIQTALERIRAKSLAMHSSNDLYEVALTFREQMGLLGQSDLESSNIHFYNKDSDHFEAWYTNRMLNHPDSPILKGHAIIPKDACTWTREVIAHFSSSKSAYTIESKGEMIRDWYEVLTQVAPETVDYNPNGQIIVPDLLFYHFSKFSDGALLMITEEPSSGEAKELQQRAAHVFDFAYRRYLDLKQAEAQSREATIEAALERVRGKALAMHESKDLSSTASIVFTELRKIGIKPLRCGVGIVSKDSRKAQLYSATQSGEGDQLSLIGWVILSDHPVLNTLYDHVINNEDYFPVLSGDQLKSYYEAILPGFSVPTPNWSTGQKQYGHFIMISVGSLYAWSDLPYTDPEIKILKRFATIIDLTFRRYLELQHSEANAKEAIKQSSLDRVRAEIASMRTVDDLNHITPIVWRELTTLGVPFFRCGIYIIKEDEQLVHIYLSTPEGKSLAVLHLPFTGADITIQTVDHWRKQQIYSTHWDQDQFISWVKTLQGQGQVQSAESYQGAQAPPESLTLQFIPFTQGMLYIGSADALNDDQLSLAKELANAFSVAYARYEDFKKLEEAKTKIEVTLTDLKAAQSQLVQSEKMASLGELTAGIAHEIQNPLNFVNNFADINNELIKELVEEASKEQRDASYEHEIIATIKENSEKINHHGKRAESIVRGMLQHSRKSTGAKEPTDINALADEYMRLSYHGLRAKDKSFNADLKMDLDSTLPLINVIPQDIGRVFLNLFNNAFWAANESKKAYLSGRQGKKEKGEKDESSGLPSSFPPFLPQVTLTTKNLGDQSDSYPIEIRIADNGPGIPPNIIDKIFQPFFTTKPTGQGTGLGLSLAYDIIKAHGGEIRVESKDAEGAEFVIELPMKGTV